MKVIEKENQVDRSIRHKRSKARKPLVQSKDTLQWYQKIESYGYFITSSADKRYRGQSQVDRMIGQW